MPEAKAAYAAPQARIPRTLFAHAHQDGQNYFPPNLSIGHLTGLSFTLIPDNWNGLDNFILWLRGGSTEALTIDVTVDLGSCNELYNVHTQTVAAIGVNTVLNEYECVDLTATFAVVLANLAVRDIIQVTVTLATGDGPLYYMGIELQET